MAGMDHPYEPLTGTGVSGRTIAGKYELVREVGAGGMGAVYEAKNLTTLKRCAIKLLISPDLAANRSIVKRFFREARASSVIESDHLVQIFDSGTDAATGCPFMVMELLQGEDLERTLQRLGALEPQVVAKLMLQAAIGLAKAHDAGIVHRDIKPANLFLTHRDSGDLTLKILDFGIAKVKMEQLLETSHGLTRTGAMMGTPLYMSPEQAQGAPDIDAKSDVWSLGVVMFQLLSGSLPFPSARSLGDLMVSIITADIPLLQDLAPWAPPELAEIAHRAMSRDIRRRYQSAGEVRDALMQTLSDGPRIVPEMLRPISDQHRSYVAPRLEMTDDGMLRATTRTGLTTTHSVASAVRRPTVPLVLAGVFGVAVLGVGAAAVWKWAQPKPADNAASLMSAEIRRPEIPPAAAPAPAPVRFVLNVEPEGVTVSVNGEPLPVKDHGVELSGQPGETRTVKLVLDERSIEQTVAITQSGLLPQKLSLPEDKARAPSAPRGGRAPKTMTSASPAPPEPAKPPEKKTPQIAKDLGEFDG